MNERIVSTVFNGDQNMNDSCLESCRFDHSGIARSVYTGSIMRTFDSPRKGESQASSSGQGPITTWPAIPAPPAGTGTPLPDRRATLPEFRDVMAA